MPQFSDIQGDVWVPLESVGAAGSSALQKYQVRELEPRGKCVITESPNTTDSAAGAGAAAREHHGHLENNLLTCQPCAAKLGAGRCDIPSSASLFRSHTSLLASSR